MVGAAGKRTAALYLKQNYPASHRQVARTLGVSRRLTMPLNNIKSVDNIMQMILDLSRRYLRFGYRRIWAMIRRKGLIVNHKRVYRIYREHGLGLRRKRKGKRLHLGQVSPRATVPNAIWAIDFMSDQLCTGTRTRLFNAIDESTNLCIAAVASRSFPAESVVQKLEQAIAQFGAPQSLRMDNGPEFRARGLQKWAKERGIRLIYSRPGTPTDNPCIESFNSKVRDEFLNLNWFTSIPDVTERLQKWTTQYNHEIPQRRLGYQTPFEQWKQNMIESN